MRLTLRTTNRFNKNLKKVLKRGCEIICHAHTLVLNSNDDEEKTLLRNLYRKIR